MAIYIMSAIAIIGLLFSLLAAIFNKFTKHEKIVDIFTSIAFCSMLLMALLAALSLIITTF